MTGLHALHVIAGMVVNAYLLGPGARMWQTRARAVHQPHRSRRHLLALRRRGLDLPVPGAVSALSYDARRRGQVRGYLAVFGALLVLTLITVASRICDLPTAPTVALGLTIATAKAALVALFFMHLKGEKPMVFWPLALTAFLFVALFAFVLWTKPTICSDAVRRCVYRR